MNVPEVVQMTSMMITSIDHDGPLNQSHHDSPSSWWSARKAGASSTPNRPRKAWIVPSPLLNHCRPPKPNHARMRLTAPCWANRNTKISEMAIELDTDGM